jgi:hypothetical protein
MKPQDLTTKDMMEIIRVEENTSIQKCVVDETLSISQLITRGLTDKISLTQWISNYVYIFFTTYFNITNNLTPAQSIIIANELVKRADLSPDDIICFIKSIKENENGKYGEVFNRIDPAIAIDWFMIYLNERIDAKEIYEAKKKSEHIIGSGERTSQTLPLSEIHRKRK